MKKKIKIISVIVAVIVIVVAIVGIICSTYDWEYEKFLDTSENVGSKISETMALDNFRNADDTKKVDLMQECLSDLEKQGLIKNITYSNYIFHFEYLYNDIGSGVIIKDVHTDDCWGSSGIASRKILTASQNIVTEKISSSDTDIDKQKWSFVLGATVDESFSNQYNYMATEYDSPVTDIDYSTSSDVSTYMNFANSDLVYISAHGWYDEVSRRSVIWTEEEATKQKRKNKEYKNLLKDNSINFYIKSDIDDNSENDKAYFVILPKFFENYYDNKKLENSIFLFSVCCLFGDNNLENIDFYNSLEKAGASTVIGACNSVNQGYSFLFYDKLINEYLSGKSIYDSYIEARNIIGENENVYFKSYTEFSENKIPGYFMFLGKKDTVLRNYSDTNFGQYGICIKDSDTQKPIKNVLIQVTKENGMGHIYKSDLNGFCKFELPAGEYQCKLSLNGYNDKTIDIIIEKNVITSLQDDILMEKINYSEYYYQFIKENMEIIDYDNFPAEKEQISGVFSALIKDFDNDNIDEMITFHYKDKKIVLQLLKYLDGKVKICDTTANEIYASGAGYFATNLCGVYNDSVLKIYSDSYSYGGSYCSQQYISYKVKNNKLNLDKDYSLYFVPRYDTYESKENVSGKTFSDDASFSNAVKSAGFDLSSHLHAGYSNSKFNPETDTYKDNELFKGNHIFTLIDSNTMITSGIYGFINDNTGLKSKLGISSSSNKTTTNNKLSNNDINVFEDMIDKTSWVWLSIENFNFENSTAKDVVDTYCIFSDAMGTELYDYFFNDVKRLEKDPKGKFEFGCYRFSADNFDWILKNIFEVKPNRNTEYNLMYYSGDYCYYQLMQGGGGFDYSFKTNSVYNLGNETYGIIIDLKISPDEGNDRTDKCYFVTKLKKDNNKGKYWSIIQFSKNEKIFDTSNKIL